MLIGFVLIVLGAISYIFFIKSSEVKGSMTNAQAEAILDELEATINNLYSYGEGSQTVIKVNFPQGVTNVEMEGTDIVFTIINQKGIESELAKAFLFDIELGNIFYSVPGQKSFVVKIKEDSVYVAEINPLDDLRENVVALWHMDSLVETVYSPACSGFDNVEECEGNGYGLDCSWNGLICISNEVLSEGNITDETSNYDGLVYGVECNEQGKLGNACSFGGDGDYIDVLSIDNTIFGESVSFSAWVKPISYDPTSSLIINIGLSGDEPVATMVLDSTGKLYGHIEGEGDQIELSHGDVVELNEWTHVVVVYDRTISDTGIMYINGVQTGSATDISSVNGAVIDASGNAFIGKILESDTWYFDGSIDELIIFDKVLDENEVSKLYELQNLGYAFDYY